MKYQIEVDLDEILDNINTGDIVDSIADDITQSNPEWWSTQICKPLLSELKSAFKDKSSEIVKECVKEVLTDVLDSEDMFKIAEKTIKDIVDVEIHTKLNKLLSKLV